MDSAKYQRFCEAAIRKTKKGTIQWERFPKSATIPDVLDKERSFLCSFGSGKMILSIVKETGTAVCLVSPDKNLPFQQITGEDDSDESYILRLYNLVYNQFHQLIHL